MEFLGAIAVIVALNELREWRFNSRMTKLEEEVKQSRVTFEQTCQALNDNLGVKLDGTYTFVEKASVQLEHMNRAIDAHGIRVNFKSADDLPEADFIGGF